MIIKFRDMPDFQLHHDAHGNFIIFRYVDIPPINVLSGKPNKNAGLQWQSQYLYYPNIKQAIRSIIRILEQENGDEYFIDEYADWYADMMIQLSKYEEHKA